MKRAAHLKGASLFILTLAKVSADFAANSK